MPLRRQRVIVAGLLFAAAGTAAAENDGSGWYFGLGLGSSDFSGDLAAQTRAAYLGNADFALVSASVTDNTDTVQQALAGYRLTPWLSVEVGWQDLGQANTFYSVRSIGGVVLSPGPAKINGTYSVRDAQIAAVVSVPIGDWFELVGRGGIARTRLGYDESGVGVNGQPYAFHAKADNEAGAIVGIGVAWKLAPSWSVRAGVDRLFEVGNRFALDAVSNGRFDHIDAYTLTVFWKP